MKTILLTMTLLVAVMSIGVAKEKWTHQIVQGEDATSTHYYFYHSTGQSIDRVRWVWNGGAQNSPTVTEYTIVAGKITTRHLVGKRVSIPDLVAGRDAELSLTHEHTITAKDVENLFLSATFKAPLTKRQKADLKNLKDLLAELRLRKKIKAEQDGADQSATAPESKPKGSIEKPK